MTDIVEWAESDFGFYVDRRWESGRWVLERGPIKLADYHAALLRHIFTARRDGRLPYDTVAWCEPAKSGKSATAGLIAEYAALHLDGDVILASNKRDQASSVMYKSLADSLAFNPHLRLEPGRYEVTFRNGNTARAIASNSRTEAGARYSLAVFDELWGYVYEDARRLWDEFKTDPTRAASIRLAIGYAGFEGEGNLWSDVLGAGRGEPVPELAHIVNLDGEPACWRNGRSFTFWSHVCRQPWQTPEWIQELHQSLRPAQFRRMILCEFAGTEAAFVTADQWDALVVDDYCPPARGELFGGVDLAVKHDCAAVVTVTVRDGVFGLGPYRIWKPPVSLDAVEGYILRLAGQYTTANLAADPFQAALLIERLRRRGVQIWEYPQTVANMTLAGNTLLDVIRERRLVVWPGSEDLRRHVLNATARETDRGIRLVKSQHGRKIDGAISLAMAVATAQEMAGAGEAEWGAYPFAGWRGDNPEALGARSRAREYLRAWGYGEDLIRLEVEN